MLPAAPWRTGSCAVVALLGSVVKRVTTYRRREAVGSLAHLGITTLKTFLFVLSFVAFNT